MELPVSSTAWKIKMRLNIEVLGYLSTETFLQISVPEVVPYLAINLFLVCSGLHILIPYWYRAVRFLRILSSMSSSPSEMDPNYRKTRYLFLLCCWYLLEPVRSSYNGYLRFIYGVWLTCFFPIFVVLLRETNQSPVWEWRLQKC